MTHAKTENALAAPPRPVSGHVWGGAPMPADIDCRDPVVAQVRADLLRRSELGIAKYGCTLEGLSLRQALQHAYEETLDRANYLCAAIRRLDAGERLATRDAWDNEPSGWAGRGA